VTLFFAFMQDRAAPCSIIHDGLNSRLIQKKVTRIRVLSYGFRIHKHFIRSKTKPHPRCVYLRRSRLETYETILGALAKRPSKIDRLAYKVNLDCVALRKNLDFLIGNGLVEERFLPKGTSYAATERGISVFKTLDFQKCFKKIQDTLLAIDGAMKVVPEISKRKENSEKELSDEKY
jgi:predicted transcriptional regulator